MWLESISLESVYALVAICTQIRKLNLKQDCDHHCHIDMAAALRRFFTRRRRPVADPVTEPAATESRCPCTDPDKEQFSAAFYGDSLRGEFELPTAGDVEWLLFSYT